MLSRRHFFVTGAALVAATLLDERIAPSPAIAAEREVFSRVAGCRSLLEMAAGIYGARIERFEYEAGSGSNAGDYAVIATGRMANGEDWRHAIRVTKLFRGNDGMTLVAR